MTQFINGGKIKSFEFEPESIGLKRSNINDLKGGTPDRMQKLLLKYYKELRAQKQT